MIRGVSSWVRVKSLSCKSRIPTSWHVHPTTSQMATQNFKERELAGRGSSTEIRGCAFYLEKFSSHRSSQIHSSLPISSK